MPLKPTLDRAKVRNIATVILVYTATLALAIVGSIMWGIV